MSADQESNRAPTSPVPPHPRHRSRSLHHDRWYITGTQHHHEYPFHLVDDDDLAPHHYDPAPHDDNDYGPQAGHRHPTPNSSSDSLSPGDRGPHRETLESIRTGDRAVGDRDRLERIELPARRGEPHWVLFHLPDGTAAARSHVRRGRVLGLVCGAFRCRGQCCGSCVALRVCWFITLATLTWVVL